MTAQFSKNFNVSGLALASAAALIAILYGSFGFFNDLISINSNYLLCGSALMGILFLVKQRSFKDISNANSYALALLLVFLSNIIERNYNLILGPTIRGEIILFTIIIFFISLKSRLNFRYLLIASSFLLIYCFFKELSGRLIFADDHTVFFYRLSLLKENFPYIPFYNPEWNAGIDQRDFFATGALSVYLIFYPLIQLFKLEQTYNIIIALLLFVIFPLSTYLAARILKYEKNISALAACIALVNSLLWYRWGLKYGTLGFITSTCLTPLNLALCYRIIFLEDLSWKLIFAFIITFSLMLLWPLAGIVFIPVIILAITRLLILLKSKYIIFTLVALLVINLPWISIFWSVSKVGNFVAAQEQSQTFKHKIGFSLEKTVKHLHETTISINPVILFLLIPGLALMFRNQRKVWIATSLWLALLGILIVHLKPQLELDRMLIVLGIISAIPAATAIQSLLNGAPARVLLGSFCCAYVFTGTMSAGSVILNRSIEQYQTRSDIVPEMANAIKSCSQGGRTIFAGFILHELAGGHLAPLAKWTSVPLIASSHVHDVWKYKNVVPKEFIEQGAAGIEKFFNLLNVDCVIAHEESWKHEFDAKNNLYQTVWQKEHFKLYRRVNFKPNYFIEGSGKIISQNGRQVVFMLDSSSALLSFKYLEFLKVAGCKIEAEKFAKDLQLIRLSECKTGVELSLQASPTYQRILGIYE